MRKILSYLIIVVSFFSLSSITAELYAPKRVFEYGLDFGAGVSNNYFTAAEFLVEDLVIDLKKINSEMPKDGLTIDYEVDAENYFSLNLNESFRLKVFFGLEGSGYANVSKDLFKLLGEGYKVGTTEKIEVNSYGDLFFNTGFKYRTKVKNYGIYITPTYYIPLVFMADTHGKVTYSSSLSGKLQANAEIPLTLYSVIDLEDIENFDQNTISSKVSEAVKSGGFSVNLGIERKVTKTLDMGINTQIPIIPGTMKHKMEARLWGYAIEENLLGKLDETEYHDYDYGTDDPVYSDANYKVHKPFKLGLEAAWRPFGNWCTIYPSVGLVIRNPYSNDAVSYGEYSLLGEFVLFKTVGLKFGTSYVNRVFNQSAGFILNLRLVELDANVSFRGADFVNSFDKTGASVNIGVRVGF